MFITRRPNVSIGEQVNFSRAMDISKMAVLLETTGTAGDRQINITSFDDSDSQQDQVSASAVVTADSKVLLLFYVGVTEGNDTGYVLTNMSSALSVPAGGYITITDGNSTDASDTISVEFNAE